MLYGAIVLWGNCSMGRLFYGAIVLWEIVLWGDRLRIRGDRPGITLYKRLYAVEAIGLWLGHGVISFWGLRLPAPSLLPPRPSGNGWASRGSFPLALL